MGFHRNLGSFALTIALLSSTVSARRGGRGGGGSSGSGGGSSDDGDSLSSLSLEPLAAAKFAICIAFAVFTALQAIQAATNLWRRIKKEPPAITLPQHSVGRIFPPFLLLSTIAYTVFYVLQAVFLARAYNQNASASGIDFVGYTTAFSIMALVGDVSFLGGILALISHRRKVLLNSSGKWHDVKMIADAILVVILVALYGGYVGLQGMGVSTEDGRMAFNLYKAYISFYFIAAVNVFVSSIAVFIRTRHSPVHDQKILRLILFIISPLYLMVAVLPIVVLTARPERDPSIASFRVWRQWELAQFTIATVIVFVMILVSLRLGMPPIPKKNGGSPQVAQAGVPPQVYHGGVSPQVYQGSIPPHKMYGDV